MTVKGAFIVTAIASLSLLFTSSESIKQAKYKVIVLEEPPKVLTTKEVIQKTTLYHDLNRVEWLLEETEKELQRQNANNKRFTQDTAGKVQSQVSDNSEQLSGGMGNRHIHSIQ